MMDAQKLIDLLNLEPRAHREGGYFHRTYESKMNVSITDDEGTWSTWSVNDPNSGIKRHIMTSIYFLLTRESSIMCMNLNRSDIIHYYHQGCPAEYLIINPRDLGDVSRERLGPDIFSGQKFQVLIPGGCWRCAHMLTGSELGANSDGPDILLRVKLWPLNLIILIIN